MSDLVIKSTQGGSSAPATAVGKMESDMKGLPYIPNELINRIAEHLEHVDISSMSLVSRRFAGATITALQRSLVDGRTIYPRYASVARVFGYFKRFPVLKHYVRDLTLVAEGLKMSEYGCAWEWEDLQHRERLNITAADWAIIEELNDTHAHEMYMTGAFINGGGYRTMLSHILTNCPNLRSLTIRKLKVGEHIPGWADTEKLQQLSFYHPHLNINHIYYGDWQYDTVHFRVTHYKNAFGEDVVDPGAGPQAGFVDDLMAAVASTGRRIEINFMAT